MSSSSTTGPITVVIKLFAAYAEVVGRASVDISLPPGATVAELLDELRKVVPEAIRLPSRPLCAVNFVHVLPSHRLGDGDEVAILPPLAGG